MICDEADEVIQELFASLPCRYQTGLEESMKSRYIIFDCVNLLHYKCHKINLKWGGSSIDSPDWIKSNNDINEDNKCFQYAATVALNHKEIRKKLQIISKINPFIDRYSWKGTNYPSRKDAWISKVEKNNQKLLLMHYMLKNEYIYLACILKHTLNHENQTIFYRFQMEKYKQQTWIL